MTVATPKGGEPSRGTARSSGPADIRVATAADTDPIFRLLAQEFQWEGSAEAIRRLLTHPWGPPGTPHALVAEVEGQVVGFIATILSRWPRHDGLSADGEARSNLIGSFSFYHVHRNYRFASLPLLRAALAQAGRWTSLTPNPYSQAILKMVGFRTFSTGFRFLLPGGSGWRRDGWRARRATADDLRSTGTVRLAEDHRPYGCGICVATDGVSKVVVVTRRRYAGTGRLRLPVSEVLFVSAPEHLAAAWPALAPVVAWHDRTVLVTLDDYFDPQHRIRGGWARARVRMARGVAESESLDALYSELVLLS